MKFRERVGSFCLYISQYQLIILFNSKLKRRGQRAGEGLEERDQGNEETYEIGIPHPDDILYAHFSHE